MNRRQFLMRSGASTAATIAGFAQARVPLAVADAPAPQLAANFTALVEVMGLSSASPVPPGAEERASAVLADVRSRLSPTADAYLQEAISALDHSSQRFSELSVDRRTDAIRSALLPLPRTERQQRRAIYVEYLLHWANAVLGPREEAPKVAMV